MKYLFTVLFTFLFMACIHGQGYQIITTVDTLQSGDVIVTQTDINGNIIDKGLAKPGFVFENDTSELVYTPPPTPNNTGDIFVDNIDMPGVEGGFLPQDIIFNPHNGNYYIYGYRKVLVCDVDMNVIKTLEISNLDNFTGFYSDYDQKMICVHPTQNMVYCLTLEGVLVSIDQYYNVTELTTSLSNVYIERASMIHCPVDNSIWYYLLAIDATNASKTILKKYSLTDGLSASYESTEIITFDLEFIPMDNHYKMFLSTQNGIRVFDQNMVYINTFGQPLAFDHIEKMNYELLAHPLGEKVVKGSLGCGVKSKAQNSILFNNP